MSKVNLKDLAKALNISVSTVSKALRDSYEISDETKKKVIAKAQLMGYNPNPYAGFLRNQKSKTIAIVVPELTNNYFVQAISGAESIAQEYNYHILIYTTNDHKEKEASILNHLINGRVDGVLMSVSSNTSQYAHINELIQAGVPVVFFDRICHEIETAKITTNDFASGFMATEHLIKVGCKKIAYLSISEHLSIDHKRKQGYLEALNKHDLKFDPTLIIQCGTEEKQNVQKIKKILTGNNKPDGIFASVERLALTTYHVCNSNKINIPKDLKVISFSNLRTADLLNPSLTTITQPAFEIGKEAAVILFKHLAKRKSIIANENIVINSELIVRGSTSLKTK
jgi:LacI family transcriptional regulator